MPTIDAPNSVLLLVGREEFTVPGTFGKSCVAATSDCVAIGLRSAADGPSTVIVRPTCERDDLLRLGDVDFESEGFVTLRDVYGREYETIGVEPGPCRVTVWADDENEPADVLFEVRETRPAG